VRKTPNRKGLNFNPEAIQIWFSPSCGSAREEGYKTMVEKNNSINTARPISIPAFKMHSFSHKLFGWEWNHSLATLTVGKCQQ